MCPTSATLSKPLNVPCLLHLQNEGHCNLCGDSNPIILGQNPMLTGLGLAYTALMPLRVWVCFLEESSHTCHKHVVTITDTSVA